MKIAGVVARSLAVVALAALAAGAGLSGCSGDEAPARTPGAASGDASAEVPPDAGTPDGGCGPCTPPDTSTLGLPFPVNVTTCCQPDGACGVDASALAEAAEPLLGGSLPRVGCIDPADLADGGLSVIFGLGVPLADGGLVRGPDGGALFEVDPACEDIPVHTFIVEVVLPGCCRPDGTCGGSTHQVASSGQLPFEIELVCGTTAELQRLVDGASPLPGLAAVGHVEARRCTFGPGAPPADAGTAPGDAGPD